MPKSNKKTESIEIPSYWDDSKIQMIRNGKSKADKNFLIDDPRFTEEAMEKRSQAAMTDYRRESKKKILEKFGKYG